MSRVTCKQRIPPPASLYFLCATNHSSVNDKDDGRESDRWQRGGLKHCICQAAAHWEIVGCVWFHSELVSMLSALYLRLTGSYSKISGEQQLMDRHRCADTHWHVKSNKEHANEPQFVCLCVCNSLSWNRFRLEWKKTVDRISLNHYAIFRSVILSLHTNARWVCFLDKYCTF